MKVPEAISVLAWRLPFLVGGVRLRVSFLFVAVMMAAWWRLNDVFLACAATVILLLSVFAGAMARTLTARLAGSSPRRCTLWPGGSIDDATWGFEGAEHSALQVASMGPIANLLIACLAMTGLRSLGAESESLRSLVHPFMDWGPAEGRSPLWHMVELAALLNIRLVFLSCLPLLPFCGGELLRFVVRRRLRDSFADELVQRLSMAMACALLIPAIITGQSVLAGLLTVIVLIHAGSRRQSETTEEMPPEWGPSPVTEGAAHEEPVEEEADCFGYDFSAGYQSLEESATRMDAALTHSNDRDDLIADIKSAARAEEAEAALLDRLLEKVHAEGWHALASQERAVLRRLSESLRQR